MLYVVAIPQFAPPLRAWVDAARKAHDPQSPHIGPHVTLLFKAPKGAEARICERVMEEQAPLALGFGPPRINRDWYDGGFYIWLPLIKGEDKLRAVHERLLAPPLDWMKDKKRPFQPHLTLGRFELEHSAEDAHKRLPPPPGPLEAAVKLLEVVAVGEDKLTTRLRHALG